MKDKYYSDASFGVLNLKLSRADFSRWKNDIAEKDPALAEWKLRMLCSGRTLLLALYIIHRKGGIITPRHLATGIDVVTHRNSYSIPAAKGVLSRLKELGLIEPGVLVGEYVLVDPTPECPGAPRSSPTKGS